MISDEGLSSMLFGSTAPTPSILTPQPTIPGTTTPTPIVPETIQVPGATTPGILTPENLATGAQILQGVSGAAAGIAGYRQAGAEAKMARAVAQENANRVYRRLRAVASRGRAIAGAQGTTGAGSELLTYLSNLQEADLAANTELYTGEAQALYAKEKGRQALRTGLFDLAGRAGTALLRRT